MAYHLKIDGNCIRPFWIRNPGSTIGIFRQIGPFRRNQIDHNKGREYVRLFWIRNLGPSASGAGSQYD